MIDSGSFEEVEVPAFDNWVDQTFSKITSSSLNDRLKSIETLTSILNDEPEEYLTDVIIPMIFYTENYEDRKSRLSVEKLITILTTEKFRETFIPEFLKLIDKNLRKLGLDKPIQALCKSKNIFYNYLRWIDLVISHTPVEFLKPEIMKKIINIQSNLLNLIESQFSEEQFKGKQTSNRKLHRYSLTKSAFSTFSATIRSNKNMLQLYLDLVFENPKTIDIDRRIIVGVISKILYHPKYYQGGPAQNLRGTIIELYLKLVISSPITVSIATHALYENLIKSLTKDEFVKLVPDITRIVLKTPKVTLPVVLHLVSNATFPFDNSILQQLIDSFVPSIKSDDPTIRTTAIEILQIIYNRSKSDLIPKLLIGLASDRNSSPVTKEFCAKSLYTFISNPVNLLPLYKAPGSEKLKSDALAAIGNWLGAENSMSKDIIDILEQLLKQAKTRRLALQCLAPSLRSVEIQKQLGATKIFGHLISEILQKDIKTQPYKIDYLLAIYSASLIAQHNPALVKQLEGHQIWAKVFSQDSFLWSHEFFLNLAEIDGLAVLDFSEVAVRFQKYLNDQNNCLFFVLSYLLTFSGTVVFKRTCDFVKNISQLDNISAFFFKGFFSLVDYLLQQNIPLPTRIIGSLLTIVSSINITSEFFGPVLMLISHSQLSVAKTGAAIYKKIQKLSGFVFTEENNNEAVKFFAHNIFYSPIPSLREASIRALVLLSKIGGNITDGISQLINTLRSADLLHLTEQEIALYFSPEGELFDKSVLGTEYESRSSGKKKDDDDDVPSKSSQQARGSGGKQRGGRGGAQGGKQPSKSGPTKDELIQKAVEQQLEVEAEQRNIIKNRVAVGKSVLSVLSMMSELHPTAIQTFLPKVIDEIFGLLVHPILKNEASECLEKMAKCVPLSGNLAQLSAILLNKLLSKQEEYIFTTSETVGTIVGRLDRISTNSLIPTPAFFFVYPIIHEAIINPPSFKLQEAALAIIERHTQPEIEYPRPKMIESLLYLVDSHPVLNKKALKILITVCEGVTDYVSELFDGLFSNNEQIRNASLQGIFVSPFLQDFSKSNLYITSCLLYARNDSYDANRDLANRVWSSSSYEVPDDLTELLKLLESTNPAIQLTAAKTIALAVSSVCEFNGNTEFAEATLDTLLKLYGTYLPPPPRMTIRGLEYSKDEKPHTRVGVAKAIAAFAPCMAVKDLEKLFNYLLANGPLVDPEEEVRQSMIEAGNAIIDRHGAEGKSVLLPIFEKGLETTQPGGNGALLRESLIIFLGRIACNFEHGSPKILAIANSLIESLSAPSPRVQNAIAECLMVLSKSIIDEVPKFIDLLFNMLEKSSEDHISRGSAHAIAGIIKGIGVPYLKKLEIVTKLNTLIESKNPYCRVGALFCFECLSKRFGRAFEPYVVLESVLNKLLKSFGDSSTNVRDATASTSKVIMSQLSPHGVKKIAPALVKSLGDNNWRTKKAAIDLLGSMAFCSPKHLSSCLPDIVPPLVNVLSYTHVEVQKATREALGHISSVIRNPEIQSNAQTILKALVDPVTFTEDALEQLIRTNFVHVIDAPSLALIIPIIERGLRDRKTAVKKNAAQIVGNMTTLAAHGDLEPYLSTLIPSLKTTLCDVIPETRYVSARALGYMVKGLGEEKFSDLLPWLLTQLRSEESTVVRSGAAQGLSQVFAALDIRRFENMFPQLLASASSEKASVREGVIGLFVFTPVTLKKDLEKYLPRILPVILEGLSDEVGSVREISMRAGQAIVGQYALSSMAILLPSLEEGLFHPNWRIRQSSIQLLGDLLYNIAGEDAEGNRRISPEALEKCIGSDKYRGVLAALYLIRSDVTAAVRQQALIVWKSFVQNTPKTLKEILSTLLEAIIVCIGSTNEDRRHVGSKTLGEITKKMGDQIIPTIIPILRKDLSSEKSGTRQGVCLGLSEILHSAPKHQMTAYLDDIIPAIRKALCDPDQDVREAAAITFDTLFSSIGTRVIDETLPTLLNDMRKGDENAELAINGLKEILSVRSKFILPHLIPQLLAPPLTESNCMALVSVCEVSGKALYRSLHQIIDTLMPEITTNEFARNAASAAVIAVKDDGLHFITSELLDYIKSEDDIIRQAAAILIEELFTNSTADLTSIISPFIQTLILTLKDSNQEVLICTTKAIDALVKSIPEDQRGYFVNDLRRCLLFVKEQIPPGETLPGFCIPGGVDPVVTIFLQGLRTGSPDIRENSAKGLTDAINLMSNEALAPTIKQITGALIRVMGDRFIASVKAAIMQTINVILIKGGQSCKFFAIQLQTICTKALTDESKEVRNYAIENISELTKINPRIDSLITELLNSSSNADVSIQESILKTLSKVLKNASNLTEKIAQSIEDKMSKLLTSQSPPEIKNIAATVYGSFTTIDRFPQLLKAIPAFPDVCGSVILATALKRVVNSIEDPSHVSKIATFIENFLRFPDVYVKQEGFKIIMTLIADRREIWQSVLENLMPMMIDLIKDPTAIIKIAALQTIKKFAKSNPIIVTNYFNFLIPLLMERIKDRISLPVKQEAERTLLYVSQVKRDPEILLSFARSLDQVQKNAIVDYYNRILSKMEESDDEQ